MRKLWGIKNCNSVKKALDFLNHRKIEYLFIDYKKSPPSKEILQKWVAQAGMENVLNSKSATYRKLGISKESLSEDEKITLMSKNPTLIKRPILEDGNQLEFGFREDRYEEIF